MKDAVFSRGDHSPPVVRLLLIVAMVLLIQGTGWADVLIIQGTTAGSFGGGAPGCSAPFQDLSGGEAADLQYTNCGSINLTTNSQGYAEIPNLGEFSLGRDFLTGVGVFTLQVTIEKPPGSGTGSMPLLVGVSVIPFHGDITGGAVIFDAGQTMNFTSPEGSFSLEVNPLSLLPGDRKLLTGQITNATVHAVPESYDLALVGLGVLGTVIRRFRRRTA